jgi:hypothetical protein
LNTETVILPYREFNETVLKRFENSQITDYGKYESIFKELLVHFGSRMTYHDERILRHNLEVVKQDDFWLFKQNSCELKVC